MFLDYKIAYSKDSDFTELLDIFSPADALPIKYPLSPNNRACSSVVIALRFGTQGPGFEPCLFLKACDKPLRGC